MLLPQLESERMGTQGTGQCCGAAWSSAADWQSAQLPRSQREAAVINRRAGCQPNATYFSRSQHSAFVVGRAILPAAAF
jgi:hypothetical protein